MSEWFWLGLIFVGVTLFVFLVISMVSRQREKARRRAQTTLSSAAIDLDAERKPVLGELTRPIAENFPVGEEAGKDIAVLLRQAGYYQQTALIEFAAVRAVLILLPLAFTLILSLLADEGQSRTILMVGAVIVALGYSIPRVYIASKAKKRQREIESGLPVAVDLLSMSLLGGLNLYAGMERVSKEIVRAYPALAEELEIVRLQAQLNSLPVALEQWAERVQIPEVSNLVSILTQAQLQGSDITSALFEYSNNFRAQLRVRAESQANRAGVWMIFPTIFCLWLPAAMILVGPIFSEFSERRNTQEASQQQIQERNQELSTPPAPDESDLLSFPGR